MIFLSIIAIRLLKPKAKVIPFLIILDIVLLAIASRAFINSFWKSLFGLMTTKLGLIALAILVADYCLRFTYFRYDINVDFENPKTE